MALKHKLDSLDGLDEALKPLYAKGEDGRFTLQVEDAPATNTIAKLKADLDAATKALKEREGAEAKAQADAERAKLEAKGDYEKLRQHDLAELTKLQKEALEAKEGLKSYLLDAELSAAIAKHTPDPHLKKLVKDQFEVVEVDGTRKVLVKGDPSKTPEQFIEALKADPSYGNYFPAQGVPGGGAPPAGGKAAGNAFDKMTKTQLAQAANNPATKAAAEAYLAKNQGG